MRTRAGSISKSSNQSSGEESMVGAGGLRGKSRLEAPHESGTLADISKKAVGKLVQRVNARGSSRTKRKDNGNRQYDSVDMRTSGSKMNEKQDVGKRVTWNDVDGEGCSRDAMEEKCMEVDAGRIQDIGLDTGEELDDSDWEDGSTPAVNSVDNDPDSRINGVTIEFDAADSAKRKPVRRASAEDKELAELVHKVHLLCLLARGRLIDCACDDPLIQASLLSLLPTHLFKISEESKLTVKALSLVAKWFHDNFRVVSSNRGGGSIHSALAHALESREGSPEEIAALSVALFRALKLTTRFVSILDAVSLKPEVDKNESSQDGSRWSGGIFSSPTLMVTRPTDASISPVNPCSSDKKKQLCDSSSRDSPNCKERVPTSKSTRSKKSLLADALKVKIADSVSSETYNNVSEACITEDSQDVKRKGDVEFEMQLQMALSATAVEISESNIASDSKNSDSNSSNLLRSLKRMKRIQSVESSTASPGISTAVGSRKVGSPLYWAEVYCSGENLTGKWVHVDAANAIIDGEHKVEAAAAACRTSLRYVVAFAGRGAKDVTRRYCMQWYKVAPKRVNSIWWDGVLGPLRELESGGTGDMTNMEKNYVSTESGSSRTSDFPIQDKCMNLPGKSSLDVEPIPKSSILPSRSSLEDMELETRALTEPLPTNQQAYRNHPLYVIERWLNKHQILYPKGPVLGFCSGHPVYPRTCVQTLKTKSRWLREALQVKANELPVKVIKNSAKLKKEQVFEAEDYNGGDSKESIELYGKWQLEPLDLPHAVNGIVPKNERGQVDVWSEKCLPPGTVHLRLPRVFSIAKRLEIDYAPAMVGFEFRNGRSTPVFDGIVVCSEFKDIILEAYAEEEKKREAEERKRREAQAISRWYQLLSSIVTRQKLNNCYGDGMPSLSSSDIQIKDNNKPNVHIGCGEGEDDKLPGIHPQMDTQDVRTIKSSAASAEDHVHVYLVEDQSYDEENSIRTKRCHCGFSIQVEEL